MTIIRNGLLAIALGGLTVAVAAPAAAAPLASATIGITSTAPSMLTEVRHRNGHRARAVAPRHYGPGPGYYGGYYGGPDTVGSLTYGPGGYAYNRFSGQRYQTCVFDEGYGRVRPCDAGRW